MGYISMRIFVKLSEISEFCVMNVGEVLGRFDDDDVWCDAGISRDHWHKRRATGGKRAPIRKKRKYELGRPAANTKVSLKHNLFWHVIYFNHV